MASSPCFLLPAASRGQHGRGEEIGQMEGGVAQ